MTSFLGKAGFIGGCVVKKKKKVLWENRGSTRNEGGTVPSGFKVREVVQ